MCLAIPSKVISVQGDIAIVSVEGSECEASIQLLDDVKPGDYVLIHTGFAIQKISEEEAMETLHAFKELNEIQQQMDSEE